MTFGRPGEIQEFTVEQDALEAGDAVTEFGRPAINDDTTLRNELFNLTAGSKAPSGQQFLDSLGHGPFS